MLDKIKSLFKKKPQPVDITVEVPRTMEEDVSKVISILQKHGNYEPDVKDGNGEGVFIKVKLKRKNVHVREEG